MVEDNQVTDVSVDLALDIYMLCQHYGVEYEEKHQDVVDALFYVVRELVPDSIRAIRDAWDELKKRHANDRHKMCQMWETNGNSPISLTYNLVQDHVEALFGEKLGIEVGRCVKGFWRIQRGEKGVFSIPGKDSSKAPYYIMNSAKALLHFMDNVVYDSFPLATLIDLSGLDEAVFRRWIHELHGVSLENGSIVRNMSATGCKTNKRSGNRKERLQANVGA